MLNILLRSSWLVYLLLVYLRCLGLGLDAKVAELLWLVPCVCLISSKYLWEYSWRSNLQAFLRVLMAPISSNSWEILNLLVLRNYASRSFCHSILVHPRYLPHIRQHLRIQLTKVQIGFRTDLWDLNIISPLIHHNSPRFSCIVTYWIIKLGVLLRWSTSSRTRFLWYFLLFQFVSIFKSWQLFF